MTYQNLKAAAKNAHRKIYNFEMPALEDEMKPTTYVSPSRREYKDDLKPNYKDIKIINVSSKINELVYKQYRK